MWVELIPPTAALLHLPWRLPESGRISKSRASSDPATASFFQQVDQRMKSEWSFLTWVSRCNHIFSPVDACPLYKHTLSTF